MCHRLLFLEYASSCINSDAECGALGFFGGYIGWGDVDIVFWGGGFLYIYIYIYIYSATGYYRVQVKFQYSLFPLTVPAPILFFP